MPRSRLDCTAEGDQILRIALTPMQEASRTRHRATGILGTLLVLVVLLAGPVSASTIDVREGESIQSALEMASEGATIVVHPGTYQEHLIVRRSVRIIAANVSIFGGKVRIKATSRVTPLILVLQGASVEIRGVSLLADTEEYGASPAAIRVEADASVLMADCEIQGGSRGVEFQGLTCSRIEDSDISDVETGILHKCEASHRSNLAIVDTHIHDCSQDGLSFHPTTNLTLARNVIERCERYAITLSDETDCALALEDIPSGSGLYAPYASVLRDNGAGSYCPGSLEEAFAQESPLWEPWAKPSSNLRFESITGIEMSTEDLVGEVWILSIWAGWCEPCKNWVPTFAEMSERFPDTVWLHYSVDLSLEAALDAIEEYVPEGENHHVIYGGREGWVMTRMDNFIPYCIAVDSLGRVRYMGFPYRLSLLDLNALQGPYPVASFTWKQLEPQSRGVDVDLNEGLPFSLDASPSIDFDGEVVEYQWDWDSDGTVDKTSPIPSASHGFGAPIMRNVTLTVVDDDGLTDSTTQTIFTPGQLILAEDFEDAADGWYTGEDSRWTVSLDEGEYRIEVEDPEGLCLLQPLPLPAGVTNFVLELQAALRSSGYYRVLFRDSEEHEVRYTFDVDLRGRHRVTRRLDDGHGEQVLVDWRLETASGIGAESWNHIAIACRGNRLQFYMNDKLVEEVIDGSIDKGGIALAVCSQGAAAEASFDNIRLYETESLPEPDYHVVADFAYTPSTPTALVNIEFEDQSTTDNARIVSWNWDFGDGTSGSGRSATHRYQEQGTYIVRLTITEERGTEATRTKSVTIRNVEPTSNFDFHPLQPEAGQSVEFDGSDSRDADGTIVEWQWSFDGNTAVDASGRIAGWIFPAAGQHTVILTVTDDSGASDSLERTIEITEAAPPSPRFDDMWAIVIGVGTYESFPRPDLILPEHDATAMYEFLIDRRGGGFPDDGEHVYLLLNEDATWAAINQAMRSLISRAGKNDLILFYFSGHGAQDTDRNGDEPGGDTKDEFLCPYDVDVGDLFSTAILDDDIGNWVSNLASDHVVLIFDSCHSGGASKSIKGYGRTTTKDAETGTVFTDLLGDGQIVLAACEPDQYAQQDDNLGYGVFTYFLLQGLGASGFSDDAAADTDGDGRTTLAELERYLQIEVPEYVSGIAVTPQDPVVMGDRDLLSLHIGGHGLQAEGVITRIAVNYIVVDIGSRHGLKTGDVLEVTREVDAGSRGTIDVLRGYLEVVAVEGPDRSVCIVLEEDLPIEPTDAVRLVEEGWPGDDR